MAEPAYFESAWGPIRLWCAEVATVNGRRIVTHSPSSGDDHETQDRGLDQRVATCELLFDDMEGETTSGLERFNRFREQHELGETHVFTHPMLGSYPAKVGRFDHQLRDGVITASAEFIPEGRIPAVTVAAAGVSAVTGADAIAAAADVAQAELERVGMTSSVLDQARTAGEAWQEDGSTARQVLVDVGQLGEAISAEIDALGLSRGLSLWRAYRAMLLLADAVVAAGRAATADVARTITVRIGRPVALRALLATIYGARDVNTYYPLARSLNDIRTPGWIPTGFELRLPQPNVQPRRG